MAASHAGMSSAQLARRSFVSGRVHRGAVRELRQIDRGRVDVALELIGLPQTMQQANAFLDSHFVADMNKRFTVKAAQPGSAFVRLVGLDMQLLTSKRMF